MAEAENELQDRTSSIVIEKAISRRQWMSALLLSLLAGICGCKSADVGDAGPRFNTLCIAKGFPLGVDGRSGEMEYWIPLSDSTDVPSRDPSTGVLVVDSREPGIVAILGWPENELQIYPVGLRDCISRALIFPADWDLLEMGLHYMLVRPKFLGDGESMRVEVLGIVGPTRVAVDERLLRFEPIRFIGDSERPFLFPMFVFAWVLGEPIEQS